MEIIDADGHVNDGAGQDEIARYMPAGNRSSQVFPVLDHLHFHYLRPGANRAGLENPGPQEWVRFLDDTGISCSVLYPTFGLAVGRFVSEHWAIAACRAYNNWLHEKFTSKNSRLKGMALLPIQDVEAAALELRRAVKELACSAGCCRQTAKASKIISAQKFIGRSMQRLRSSDLLSRSMWARFITWAWTALALTIRYMRLGTRSGLPIQAAGMLAHGIFERFPKLRVAFLEGGSTWVPFFLDRLDRSYHRGHLQVDLEGDLVGGPKEGEKASDYLRRQMREGRMFVGFDVDDDGLGFAVQKAGPDAFVFGSDFPHEVFNAEKCRGEIDQLLARNDLSVTDKEAVLSGNARRFYSLGG